MRVLVIDEDPAVRRLLCAALGASVSLKAEVEEAASVAAAITLGRTADFAGALVSLDLGAAAEVVAGLRRHGLKGPIVATSRLGSVATAIEAIRAGADDFVVKPFQPAEVARRLAARLEESHGGGGAASPQTPAPGAAAEEFHGFIGGSPPMRKLYDQIARIAPSRAPVFVTGESGSGKEVCAETIHACSGRAAAPFIAINCSAIPKELMESEIFGHVRGAFTSAHEDRPGAAELAHGGTLFLDEICDMDLALQAKLLRFAQTGTVRRVGDTRLRHVDVRFVCATNRDPAQEIEAGRFREDLFYRLHVLPLTLPALRERGADVLLLAHAFLSRFAEEERRGFTGFRQDAASALAMHCWPGNVRELQNAIRRVVVLHDGNEVTADMLALDRGPAAPALPRLPEVESAIAGIAPSIDPFWRQEQRIIERALEVFGGNTLKAASALEISPSTIYRKRQAWAEARAGR